MTTASVQGIGISMPKPSAKPPTEKHEMHVLAINPDGTLKLDGAPKSDAQMLADLSAIKARDAQGSVVIQGDAKAQYARVVAMIDLCNDVQIGLSLATARIGF
jgi:biopolymer transport protein ExbD